MRILKKYTPPAFIKHFLGWVAYCIYTYILNFLTNDKIKFVNVIVFSLPFILVFYTSLFCLRLFKKKRFVLSVATFFSFFFILSAIGYFFIYIFLPSLGIKLYTGVFEIFSFMQSAILGYVKFFTYALLFFFVESSLKREEQFRKLQADAFLIEHAKKQGELENSLLRQHELKAQQEKLQYEYAFLRAQINPHFLYNTLNVLFSQALPYSQTLADNILKLSNIMRYSLESVEYESGKVFIQKELEHLQTLIEIHNIRFSNTMAVKYIVTGKIDGQMLPPLSMITIVENAFKYGDLKDTENPLQINVTLQPKRIYFYCRNKKKKNNIEISSNNIGITNLTRRLDVAFKNKYNLETTNDENFYTFELTIDN